MIVRGKICVVMDAIRTYKEINQWWRWAIDGDIAPLGVYRGLPGDYASWPVSCQSPLVEKRVLLFSEAFIVADHANSWSLFNVVVGDLEGIVIVVVLLVVGIFPLVLLNGASFSGLFFVWHTTHLKNNFVYKINSTVIFCDQGNLFKVESRCFVFILIPI